jgi:hypothetical protein
MGKYAHEMKSAIAAVVVAVILIAGIIGYAAVGFAYASTRVANADRSLNIVISHQNNFNRTFHEIEAQFNALSSTTTFNPKKARDLSDLFVSKWKTAAATVDNDDKALVDAKTGLSETQWLTAFSHGTLAREGGRIDHARKALSTARTIALDYAQDGEFLRSYFEIFIDLETMQNQGTGGDFAGAKATVATMKTHAARALELSRAPGLPAPIHDLMVDFQVVVTDFGKYFEALISQDQSAISAATAATTVDLNKVGTYNLDNLDTEIRAFYKPLIDAFNSEMAKATAA